MTLAQKTSALGCIIFLSVMLTTHVASQEPFEITPKICPKDNALAQVIHAPNRIVTSTSDAKREIICEFSIDGYTRYGANFYNKDISIYANAISNLRRDYKEYGNAVKGDKFEENLKNASGNIIYVLASLETARDGSINENFLKAFNNNNSFITECVYDFYSGKFEEEGRISYDNLAQCSVMKKNGDIMESSIRYAKRISATYLMR